LQKVLTEVFVGSSDCNCVGVFPDGKSAISKIPALNPADSDAVGHLF